MLYEEGLYRKEGRSSERQMLLQMIREEQQFPTDLSHYDIHSMTAVIKTLLRAEAGPLLTYESYHSLIQSTSIQSDLQELFQSKIKLPLLNCQILQVLLPHLFHITQLASSSSKTKSNNMDAHGLGKTIGIHFLRQSETQSLDFKSLEKRAQVAQILIEHAQEWVYEPIEQNLQLLPAIKVSWKLKHTRFTEEELKVSIYKIYPVFINN